MQVQIGNRTVDISRLHFFITVLGKMNDNVIWKTLGFLEINVRVGFSVCEMGINVGDL